MDSYDYYKTARDKAWQNLKKYRIKSLPVDVFEMCKKAGVYIFTYTNGKSILKDYKIQLNTDNEGFTTKINNKYTIFYDDTITPKSRINFTIAHEMGHIALGHARTGATVWNRGEQAEPSLAETQANIFASRLLAPACVLKELHIQTAEQLQEVTGLSYLATKIRLERLNKLKERDSFYLSPLEREVKSDFEKFIREYEK